MSLELRRVVIFTSRLDEMAAFYRDVIGLEVLHREDGWADLSSGPCHIALHAGKSCVGDRPPKLAFYSADVASTRVDLLKRGLPKAGPVKSAVRLQGPGRKSFSDIKSKIAWRGRGFRFVRLTPALHVTIPSAAHM